MKKLTIATYAYFAIANLFDFASTVIAATPDMEENPIGRYVWENFGTMSFFTLKIMFMSLFFIIAMLTIKMHPFSRIPVLATAWLGGTFMIIIALTNLALVPYEWTAWFQPF